MSMRRALRALQPPASRPSSSVLRLQPPSVALQHAGPSTSRHQQSHLTTTPAVNASVESVQEFAPPDLLGITSDLIGNEIDNEIVDEDFELGPGRRAKPILLPVSSLAENLSRAASSRALVELPADIFTENIRRDILHKNVVWYLASIRRGTKKTLGRSEVAYSGLKIRPQKGTGRARLSDRGSPMLVGGAHAHNLRPKSWYYDLPRKIQAYGHRAALTLKLETGFLRVVSNFGEANWSKTKEAAAAIAPLQFSRPYSPIKRADRPEKWHSILFLHAPDIYADKLWAFGRVLRNIPGVEIMSTDEVHVWHLLKYRWLIIDGVGLDAMVRRLRTSAKSAWSTEGDWQSPLAHLPARTSIRRARPENPAQTVSLPKELQWRTRTWRRIRGKKSMVRAIGFDRAAVRAKHAKRDMKRSRRLVDKQSMEDRWQRVLDKLERRALEERERSKLP